MEKIKIKPDVLRYPKQVTILGIDAGGIDAFRLLDWSYLMDFNPPLVAFGIDKGHFVEQWMVEAMHFSINIACENFKFANELLSILSNGRSVDAGKLDVIYSDDEHVPMLKHCPLSLECKFVNSVDFPHNYIFLGKVLNGYCEKRLLTGGQLDMTKIKPLLFNAPDNSLWKLTEFRRERI